MKKLIMLILLMVTAFSMNAIAAPVTYEALVTEASPYDKILTLGSALEFDYWFEMGITPPPYNGSQGFDVLFVQEGGAFTFVGQVASYDSSTSWQHANLVVPVALVGVTGNVHFGVNDFDPNTDPSVYLNNVGGNNFDGDASTIPEPGTMILLGSGLVGMAAFARKRLNKM